MLKEMQNQLKVPVTDMGNFLNNDFQKCNKYLKTPPNILSSGLGRVFLYQEKKCQCNIMMFSIIELCYSNLHLLNNIIAKMDRGSVR